MNGLNTIVLDLLENWGAAPAFAEIIVSAIGVVIWIFAGIIINLVLRKVIYRVMKSRDFESRTATIGKLLTSIVRYVVWLIILVIILRQLNIDVMPIVASAGVLGLAIGFGAQQIVKDFISGFFIIFESIFNVGDLVQIDGFTGNVLKVGLRTTSLQNWKGEVKTVSNGEIRGVINYSKNDSLAILELGVSYDTDFAKLNEAMDEFVELEFNRHDSIIEKPTYLGVTKLDDSSVNLLLIAKTKTLKHFQVERDLREDIVVFLAEKNIEIPFPHVVVKNA